MHWTFKSTLLSGLVLAFCASAWSNPETPPSPTAAASENAVDPVPQAPPEGLIPDNLIRTGDGTFYSPYALVVDKSTRTLSVWQTKGEAPTLIGFFPTDIGKKEGDKHHLNDHRTPEGVYFFQETLEGAKLNFDEYGVKAFTMDYPNFFDLREKKTGYGIWLHAIPETKTLMRGSRGCVVVRNEVIKKLSPYIELKKTPIIVTAKVNYRKPAEIDSESRRVLDWMDKWRTSWQAKQIDHYMGFYAPDFKGQGMNFNQWRAHKSGLNEKYQFIHVQIRRPVVFRHKNEWIVRFIQDYESDRLKDFGEKYLYLTENEGNDLKIVGESWEAIAGELVARDSK